MKRLLYIFAVISLIVMSLPSPVSAATVNLTVTGEGAVYGPLGPAIGTYVGGAGTWANLNSDDGDTSYINMPGSAFSPYGSGYHSWQFQVYGSGDSINNVSLTWKAYDTYGAEDGSGFEEYVVIGGNPYIHPGRVWGGQSLTGSYTLYTGIMDVDPSTGLPWTTAGINAASFGIHAYGHPLGDYHITLVYLTVDYNSLPPTVSTATATNNTYSGGVYYANLNGSIDLLGGSANDYRGFVYGTVSNATTPALTQVPPAGYASNWTESSAGFSAGAFGHTVSGLLGATIYYYRAYAHNSYGWAYGDQQSFGTLASPTITTTAVTYLGTTTAQLNANVYDSGGQLCDVRFGYDTVSHAANFAAYANKTTWVNNTYATGTTPYAPLSGLTVSTTYYYNVQIANDVGVATGVEGTFTTGSSLLPPTNFIALSSPTSIILTWNKDASSPLTEVKMSTSTYPNTTTDGSLIYLGALSSVTVTNLTIGTTYYFSAWGSGGGLFSTLKATTSGTTTAGTSTFILNPPTVTTSMWIAMPSELGLANFPLYDLFNYAFDTYSMPRATGYVIFFIFLAVLVGMLIYMKAPSNNLLLTGIGEGIMLGFGTLIGMPTHCLIPIWATLGYWLIFFSLAPVMNRY